MKANAEDIDCTVLTIWINFFGLSFLKKLSSAFGAKGETSEGMVLLSSPFII
jgi:hypothetical protein